MQDKRENIDSGTSSSKAEALEQLLGVYENSVLEQTKILYGEIAREKQSREEDLLRYAMELERANSGLKLLLDISEAVSRTFDIGTFLPATLQLLVNTEIFRFDERAAVFFSEGGELRLGFVINLPDPDVGECRRRLEANCPCVHAAATGEIVITARHPEYGETHSCPLVPSRGQVVVPLRSVDRIVGVLSLYTDQATEMDESLLELLRSVGSQVGIAINNSTLFREAEAASLHDSLTGLPNRRFLQLQMEKIFEGARRYGEHLSVIMMDIDHFKEYNDTFGHLEGDRMLGKIAGILLGELRKADQLFRYGGEEFIALLPGTELGLACNVAERLRKVVESQTGVTISLGVASYRESMRDMEALVRMADIALYRAKENGRNCVAVPVEVVNRET